MIKVLKYPCPITLEEGEEKNSCNICKVNCFSSAVFNTSLHTCSVCLEKNYLDLKVKEMSLNASSLDERTSRELRSLQSTKNEAIEKLDDRLDQQKVRKQEIIFNLLKILNYLAALLIAIFIVVKVVGWIGDAFTYVGEFFSSDKTEVVEKNKTQQVASKLKYHLTVKTTPSNATVQISNIKPKYKHGIILKPGNYNIHISKTGYKTQQGWIKLTGNTVLTRTLEVESKAVAAKQQIAVKSKKHALRIKTNPADATVKIINIKPRFYNGIRLKPDDYDIEVSKPGYRTQRFKTTINNEDKKLNINLVKRGSNDSSNQKMYTLKIFTTPKSAKIKLLTSKKKFRNGMFLQSGTYRIKVSKEGYKSKRLEVIVTANTKITVDLEKK